MGSDKAGSAFGGTEKFDYELEYVLARGPGWPVPRDRYIPEIKLIWAPVQSDMGTNAALCTYPIRYRISPLTQRFRDPRQGDPRKSCTDADMSACGILFIVIFSWNVPTDLEEAKQRQEITKSTGLACESVEPKPEPRADTKASAAFVSRDG